MNKTNSDPIVPVKPDGIHELRELKSQAIQENQDLINELNEVLKKIKAYNNKYSEVICYDTKAGINEAGNHGGFAVDELYYARDSFDVMEILEFLQPHLRELEKQHPVILRAVFENNFPMSKMRYVGLIVPRSRPNHEDALRVFGGNPFELLENINDELQKGHYSKQHTTHETCAYCDKPITPDQKGLLDGKEKDGTQRFVHASCEVGIE